MGAVKINKAAEALKRSGVAVLPSDTVYGLFACAGDKKAVKKIYDLKGRKYKKPLQVFFPDLKTASKYACISKDQKELIAKMLPGPFTVVLNKKAAAKKFSFLRGRAIGVRVIKDRIITPVMKKCGTPLAATSANISGKKDPVKFGDINKKLITQAEFAYKNDRAVKGRASIVIDFTGKNAAIIRR